jgi:hypothetical protein
VVQKLKRGVAADRLSCHAYRANAWRLQLHALAYNLLALFRQRVLAGTELATARVTTLRLRLFQGRRAGAALGPPAVVSSRHGVAWPGALPRRCAPAPRLAQLGVTPLPFVADAQVPMSARGAPPRTVRETGR